MTITEFSNEFDVLFNNIMSNKAPGLDEYEKSLFLTKAQEEILKAYFTAKGNKFMEGFEDSNKRTMDFSTLLKHTKLQCNRVADSPDEDNTYYGNVPRYVTKEDALSSTLTESLFIVSEVFKSSVSTYQVLPIKFSDFLLQQSKPYGRPLKRQVWRIIDSWENNDIQDPNVKFSYIVHDIDKDPIASVYITYIKRPNPIILTDLGTLSIEGSHQTLDIETPIELHQEILQRAVELAKAAYSEDSSLQSQLSVGNVSATNLGILPKSNN